MAALCDGQGIVPNTDISGLGVRLACYAQMLIPYVRAQWLGHSESELKYSLIALTVTNTLYCAATLIMLFMPNSTVDLYDGLVACYLLSGSWCATQTVPQAAASSLRRKGMMAQSYMVFLTMSIILFGAASFVKRDGTCHGQQIRLAILWPVNLLHTGQNVALVLVAIVATSYTTLLVTARQHSAPGGFLSRRRKAVLYGFTLLFLILNTELFREFNHIQPDDLSLGWGQTVSVLTILYQLWDFGRNTGLANYLKKIFTSESRREGRESTIMGDVMRADSDTASVEQPLLQDSPVVPSRVFTYHPSQLSHVSKLNEYLQRRDRSNPVASTLRWEGQADPDTPPHMPNWTMIAKVDGREYGRGSGPDKSTAKENAARMALPELQRVELETRYA